ncbi:MAG: YdbL family protein [Sterolibacterium sp.]|nr:YdbL family protein [Sterolibacterium sp.]
MLKTLRHGLLLGALLLAGNLAWAQANLEANTPAVGQLKGAMQGRYAQLEPFLASGAVGLARDGSVQLRDANAVPLPQRPVVNGLVAAENADRAALYREIARANGKPEWEPEIRSTFAQRWIDKAPAGWWVQDARGGWARK